MQSYDEQLAPPLPEPAITVGASFGIRFLARAYDLLYIFLLGLVTGAVYGAVVGFLAAAGLLGEDWQKLLQPGENHWLVSLVCAFLYQTISEGVGGASIGKLICGLRVVQLDGRPCTAWGSLKRNLLYHVDALFCGLVGYLAMKETPLRQRFGDRWAGTVVVKKADGTSVAPVPAWQITVGIFVASAVWAAFMLADLVRRFF